MSQEGQGCLRDHRRRNASQQHSLRKFFVFQKTDAISNSTGGRGWAISAQISEREDNRKEPQTVRRQIRGGQSLFYPFCSMYAASVFNQNKLQLTCIHTGGLLTPLNQNTAMLSSHPSRVHSLCVSRHGIQMLCHSAVAARLTDLRRTKSPKSSAFILPTSSAPHMGFLPGHW